MAASLVLLAKRALVSLLLSLAQQHGARVTVTRESPDSAVEAAFRAVVRKVHPDISQSPGLVKLPCALQSTGLR